MGWISREGEFLSQSRTVNFGWKVLHSTLKGLTNLGNNITVETIKVWPSLSIYLQNCSMPSLEINRYVRRYRKRGRAKNSALPPQRGRPSWASNQMGPLPSALKRKVSSGGYDGNFKRMKEEVDDDDLYWTVVINIFNLFITTLSLLFHMRKALLPCAI